MARGALTAADPARNAPSVDLGVLVDGAEVPAFVPDAILPISGRGGGSMPPRLPDSCEPNSFVPGTQVLMADGSAKPIEEIREGEEVLATDPVTGETTSRRVTLVMGGKWEDCVGLGRVVPRRTAVSCTGLYCGFWVLAGQCLLWTCLGVKGSQVQILSARP
ncbi:hypothetical protein AB0I53_33860 [Saccharopolyspora sp. NPDC050389]|uniref:hypothetical protein n=1 Tax=Saccharopolyspora sp. NPDC050389 TaxID=3155516 RepID=UPI0033E663E5